MSGVGMGRALAIERSCALVACALSDGRRVGARLVSGERRGFGLGAHRSVVHVPYPALAPDWTLRSLTCGVALQSAPSKDRIARHRLGASSTRRIQALTIVEAAVALGWIGSRWPGLLSEFARLVPGLRPIPDELDGAAIVARADALARSGAELIVHPLLGRLPLDASAERWVASSVRRLFGQMPWSSRRTLSPAPHTIPVAAQGGHRDPNPAPASRPDDDDGASRSDRRAGIPYPEWNAWTRRFLPDHVAVLERRHASGAGHGAAASTDLRRWFEQHTHRAMQSRLEDGADLDLDRYIDHYARTAAREATDARVFRDLLPAARDVTTAVLLDGSASLGAHHGRIFRLELACADGLSRAMALARERHGLFVFSGNTRHRVEVVCLKDFDDPRFVTPSGLGLVTGGYTRLGAPLRHLTSRLLAQPSERRLLIVIGDGLLSDEGYEGRYAWADAAHAVEEAAAAGVLIYYLGVGGSRIDPLPVVFGSKRSTRIRRVEELPRVLAHAHRALVAA